MKNKKLILLLLIGALFVVSIFYLYRQQEEQQSVVPQALRTPAIPQNVEHSARIQINITADDFSFPLQLPLLSATLKNISENEALQIANNFSFSLSPNISKDVIEGTKYIWSNENFFLFITPKISLVRYGATLPDPPETINKQLSNIELFEIASNFVSERLNVPLGNLKADRVIPLVVSGATEGFVESESSTADIYQVNLSYFESEFGTTSLEPNDAIIHVRVLPDGEIFSLEAQLLESLTPTNTFVAIKDYKEFVESAQEAEIILFDERLELDSATGSQITRLDFNRVELLYLFNLLETNILNPIFKITAEAAFSDNSTKETILFLPATKSL